MANIRKVRRYNSNRDILIDRLRRKYKMRWIDAYYCCEIIDFCLDKFLLLGIDLTVAGLITIKHDVEKIENLLQIEENKAYFNRVIHKGERFYFYKHHPQKALKSKK